MRVRLPGGPLDLLRPADPDAVAFDPVAVDEGVEELHPPHWARLWPSGRALAGALAGADPGLLAGRAVLELGCGLGLPSLVAARAGADPVLATDRSAAAVGWVAASARRAGLRVGTAVAAFSPAEDALTGRTWDLVLAADVLYGAAAATALTGLLPRVTAPGGQVWLADPGRPEASRWLDAVRDTWTVTTRALPDGVALHVLRRRP